MISPKAARLSKGLTCQQLCELVGCGIATVYRLEAANTYPRQPHLRAAYISALGLTEEQAASSASPRRAESLGAPVSKSLPSRWSRALTGARS